MAVVAQLVEPRVVISVVVGSSPISRPIFYSTLSSINSSYILSIKTLFKITAPATFGIFLCLIVLYYYSK